MFSGRSSTNKNKTIVIAAGGTGGHVFPALAIAQQLIKNGFKVIWLGTAEGIESSVAPDNDIPLHTLQVVGIRGKSFFQKATAPLLMARGIYHALLLLRKHRPCCVLGMGGFASGAGGTAAFLMSIPLVIQEQNAIAGTTNRILARFAIKIFTGFPNVFAGHKAASYSGNPLRASFYQQLLSNESASKDEGSESTPINILVLGGSLGAQSLNQVVPSALATLGIKTDFSVRHQVGKKDFAMVVETYQSSHIDARVDAFIDDIYQAYDKADLVIARAGALTVSEIAAVGVACVLIPYPYATDDHQRANAEWLVKTGGAICIDDAEFTVAKASAVIGELLTNRGELMARGNKVSSMAMPNATDIIADACLGYAYA
ncbi:MAG: undecaprenyldiphospho-muramoylpentapeptide beta-N-acetylglucosaminyltransferase [Cellvibrionales bacterium]|nr:undecaprenyldiphospho-muramoylpentapeptide beta-N-acetylglucosaminyltransferase [Cellvibrionales bacterium]|tara:strand:+ start:7343 stop:8461 length:1119 start_codon:yes stop_codon:yes gene_type:complete